MKPPQLYDIPFVDNVGKHRSAFYYKDDFGVVKLHIGATTIDSSDFTLGGSLIATLPIGYRPPFQIETQAHFSKNSNTYSGVFIVHTDGRVTVHVNYQTNFAILDCSFPTSL